MKVFSSPETMVDALAEDPEVRQNTMLNARSAEMDGQAISCKEDTLSLFRFADTRVRFRIRWDAVSRSLAGPRRRKTA